MVLRWSELSGTERDSLTVAPNGGGGGGLELFGGDMLGGRTYILFRLLVERRQKKLKGEKNEVEEKGGYVCNHQFEELCNSGAVIKTRHA